MCLSDSNLVKVAISATPLSSPLIIAKEKGYFKRQGVAVEFKIVIGGMRAAKSLNKGEVDMATSSEAVIMFNSFKNNNFVVLSTFVSSNNDVKVLAMKDKGIKSLEDLTGKRVGTILGTSAHFFLDYTMLAYGIDTQNMDIININPEDTSTVLQQKKVDAVVSWEPFIYLAMKKLEQRGFIIEHEKLYNETFNLLANKKWAINHQSQIVSFLKALEQSIHFINQNPSQSQQIVASFLDQDLAIIKASWQDLNFSLGLHQWLLYLLDAEAAWAIKREFIKPEKKFNYLDFFMLEPMKIVKPGAISIISH